MMKIYLSKLILTVCVLVFGLTPLTVSASSKILTDPIPVTEAAETEEMPVEGEDVSYGPLTPEGNLALIDDYGKEESGKQFITIQTKSGNYFYLIIDRDAQGSEIVHFLNQVEEADLLTIMEPEEAEAYLEQKSDPVTTKDPEETDIEVMPEKEETAEETGEETAIGISPLTGILLFGGILGVGGVLGYFYVKKNKQQERNDAPVKDESEEEAEEPDYDEEDMDAEEEEE